MSIANFIRKHRPRTMWTESIFAAFVLSLLLSTAGFFMSACTPLEQTARDLAATANGFITQAQSIHAKECHANPALKTCAIINQAVGAQNVLIDAAESYCGWPARPTPAELASATTSCARIKSATPALQTAVRNLNDVMGDLRAAAGVTQ